MIDIVTISQKFAKVEYSKHDEYHQWRHVEGVMRVALELAKNYKNVDLEILILAVIFHDISYKRYETHVEESLKVAENFLKKQNYLIERTNKVLEVMLCHSGPHRRKFGEAKSIEGKIIYDADKFNLAKTKEGFNRYYNKFYLNKTRELLDNYF